MVTRPSRCSASERRASAVFRTSPPLVKARPSAPPDTAAQAHSTHWPRGSGHWPAAPVAAALEGSQGPAGRAGATGTQHAAPSASRTDAALLAAYVSAGTTAATTAATAAGLQSFISVEGAAAYKGTGGDFANKLVASTDAWAAIAGFADTTGRALYS